MVYEVLSVISVIMLLAASLAVLITYNWRVCVLSLAVQYLAAFWLINLDYPLAMAAVKLVVGWMVCAMLGATPVDLKQPDEQLPGRLFRLLASAMVWILVFSIAPSVLQWVPTGMVILWGGLALIGMGLLQIGMTTFAPRIVVGLLTILSGFEILYSVLESSVLVVGLLAIVNLGMALAGSYLMTVSGGLEV
ncbi:MAG: hypothetical protein HPY45_06120 [Anaerolineae bacterium]|nr:hypothetical protein [Anaerolineae bacterium]